jgi:DNA invertase Pin-like site-specific DNA recombinase
MRSELIDGRHLARRAVIYIRQSTPHRVLTNQESLRLQYDLRRRALDLGWREEDIEVIDSDLGLSGAAAAHRAGFKDLIARVTLGQVGIVLSSEVTRLSRNCTDWYPLLDLCGYRQCLIGDRDGVYDPASANGRLLLGLKGTISEMELHTIRARLTAGLLNKAERGELGLMLPVGLVRDAAGLVVKNPDCEVQARLELVFATFLRRRSAAKVLRSLNEGGLALPRRGRLGGVLWRPPTVAAVLRAQEPRVCRSIRLRPHAVDPRCRDRDAQAEEASPRAVEDRREGQVPRLRQLGDVREDPGHAARQLCRV